MDWTTGGDTPQAGSAKHFPAIVNMQKLPANDSNNDDSADLFDADGISTSTSSASLTASATLPLPASSSNDSSRNSSPQPLPNEFYPHLMNFDMTATLDLDTTSDAIGVITSSELQYKNLTKAPSNSQISGDKDDKTCKTLHAIPLSAAGNAIDQNHSSESSTQLSSPSSQGITDKSNVIGSHQSIASDKNKNTVTLESIPTLSLSLSPNSQSDKTGIEEGSPTNPFDHAETQKSMDSLLHKLRAGMVSEPDLCFIDITITIYDVDLI